MRVGTLAPWLGLGLALAASGAQPGQKAHPKPAAPQAEPEEEAPTIREQKPWDQTMPFPDPGPAPGPGPVPGYGPDPFQDFDQVQEHMEQMFSEMDKLFDETWGRPFSPGSLAPGGGDPRFGFPPAFDDPSSFMRGFQGQGFGSPDLDIVEEAGVYKATMDLPGASPADVKVSVEGDTLHVSGSRQAERRQAQGQRYLRQERAFGNFSRAIPLPGPVDASKLEIDFQNGVLTVTIPKKIR